MLWMPLFLWMSAGADKVQRPDFCSMKSQPQVEKRIPLPDEVNYFTRASSRGEVGFATNKGNRILDLNTEKLNEAPGTIDPVPSPDGAFLTVPMQIVYDSKLGRFRDLNPNETPSTCLMAGKFINVRR